MSVPSQCNNILDAELYDPALHFTGMTCLSSPTLGGGLSPRGQDPQTTPKSLYKDIIVVAHRSVAHGPAVLTKSNDVRPVSSPPPLFSVSQRLERATVPQGLAPLPALQVSSQP
jgi:hypothetical protein